TLSEDDAAFRKTCDELLASWQVEASLAKEGLLNPKRDPAGAVGKLLADSRQWQETVAGVSARVKAARPAGGSSSLVDDVDWLIKERAAAQKRLRELSDQQSTVLAGEREQTAAARKAAESALAKAAELQGKLQTAEDKLRQAEAGLREATGKKEAVPATKPEVLPPIKIAKPSGGAAAYEHYTKGLRAYRDLNYSDAEKEFQDAVEADN